MHVLYAFLIWRKGYSMGKTKQPTKQAHISVQLLTILVPLVIVALSVVAFTLALQAKSVIEREAKSSLQEETRANATGIAQIADSIKLYYDGIADVIEQSYFESDAQIEAVLADSMANYEGKVTDAYIGLSNMDFIDGAHWTPAPGYDPTTRAWYQNGIKNSAVTLGDPT